MYPAKGVGRVKSAAEVQILSSAPNKKNHPKMGGFLIISSVLSWFSAPQKTQKFQNGASSFEKRNTVANTVANSFRGSAVLLTIRNNCIYAGMCIIIA